VNPHRIQAAMIAVMIAAVIVATEHMSSMIGIPLSALNDVW